MAKTTQPLPPKRDLASKMGSSIVQSSKRKLHLESSRTHHVTIVSQPYARESYQSQFAIAVARNAVSPSTEDADTGSSSEDESRSGNTYLEPISDSSPSTKKSKLHRVASMSQLTNHLSADQLLPDITMSVSSIAQLVSRMNKSVSTPSLPSMVVERTDIKAQSRMANMNPDMHYHSMLESMGIPAQTHAALDLDDYFIITTKANTDAYGSDVIRAVRERDLQALRQMNDGGRTLQCCNNFGESILHMACRHGDLDVVQFLVHEAGVSFRVRDDFGRTPLHDAFWTLKPEIELVKMIVSMCPDMLLLRDKRGFTPLAYARRDHWGEWCEFLEENYNLLIPQEIS